MAAAGLPAQAEAESSVRFAPPREPLVITRTVWRTLHDGKQIVARRSYLVEFVPIEGGFTVAGSQIASTIEAPPALAAIARLEQARTDSEAFPLQLDPDGLIRLGLAPAGGAARLQGRDAARALIAGASLAPTDQREAEAFLVDVAAKGGAVPWPVDLFNPRENGRTERRTVALPDGETGTLTITLTAESRRADGLPRKVSREVVSELDGTRRVSREEWTFAARVGP